MELRPGRRLASGVSDAEIVIVRAAVGESDLRCGGHPMVEPGGDRSAEVDAAWDGELLVGKRWQHDGAGLEVLVTKGGRGLLSIGDEPLQLRASKQLPASD
jgi:hypothetical protein